MRAVSETDSPLPTVAAKSWLLSSTVHCTDQGDDQVETEGKIYPQGYIWV